MKTNELLTVFSISNLLNFHKQKKFEIITETPFFPFHSDHHFCANYYFEFFFIIIFSVSSYDTKWILINVEIKSSYFFTIFFKQFA